MLKNGKMSSCTDNGTNLQTSEKRCNRENWDQTDIFLLKLCKLFPKYTVSCAYTAGTNVSIWIKSVNIQIGLCKIITWLSFIKTCWKYINGTSYSS